MVPAACDQIPNHDMSVGVCPAQQCGCANTVPSRCPWEVTSMLVVRSLHGPVLVHMARGTVGCGTGRW